MRPSVTDWLRRASKWQYLGIGILVLFTLAVHFSIIMLPDKLVYDEQHYIADARSIIAGEPTIHPEHPPLGKLFIVTGIRLFGDNPFGWRFFSIIFGTVSILLLYFICRRLKLSGGTSLLAAFLFGLENLTFIQASIAMLDVYSLTFMLGGFLLFLRGNYVSSGICAGLSALAKLNGALGIAVIFLYWLFTGRRNWQGIVWLVFSSAISFLLFMPLLDYATTFHLVSPVVRIQYMLDYARRLTFASGYHEFATPPWDWLINPSPMLYYYDPQYIAGISLTVWAFIIPASLYMLYRAIRHHSASLFGILWFASTYLPWIPLNLLTDRWTYIYYFYPATGAICIGIAIGLSRLPELFKNKRPYTGKIATAAVSTYLALHLGIFVIMSPMFIPIVNWFPTPAQASGTGTSKFVAQIHFARADRLYDQKRYEQAIEEYSRAIWNDSSLVRAYANRGLAYANMKQYNQALADCDKSISLRPNPEAFSVRAGIHYDMGSMELAIADSNKAIELTRNLASPYLTRAISYWKLGNYAQAVVDSNKAIMLEPDSPRQASAYNIRGIAFLSDSKYEKAVADFSRAVELDPRYVEAYYNRGITYKAQGIKDRALADLNRFIGLTSDMERIQKAKQQIDDLTRQ